LKKSADNRQHEALKMKFLEDIFHNVKAPFEKGGKYEKYGNVLVAIDAFETFLFTPKEVTAKGVHIKDGIDLKRTMSTVIMAMVPCLLFGIYNAGFQHFRAQGILDAPFWEMVAMGAWKVLTNRSRVLCRWSGNRIRFCDEERAFGGRRFPCYRDAYSISGSC
jgi:hypothetical protein